MKAIPFPPMKRPLVAILRGIRPEETADIVSVLIDSGMTAIEIPLNSPEPFRSIEIAVKRAPAGTLIGAGTVLTIDDVARMHDVGGRLMVSPNVDPEIIAGARARGMVTMPGVFSPTEALLAGRQIRRLEPQVLSGQRARGRRHHRYSRGSSRRPDDRRGGWRLRYEFC